MDPRATSEPGSGASGCAAKMARLRVRVSGEPFDIPLDELVGHEGCVLQSLAARAPTIDGVPTLSFARDVRAFRIIRHYLATGELLVPPDPVDREILRTELDFYGFRGEAGAGDALIPAPDLQFYSPAAPGPLAPPGVQHGSDQAGAGSGPEGGAGSGADSGAPAGEEAPPSP